LEQVERGLLVMATAVARQVLGLLCQQLAAAAGFRAVPKVFGLSPVLEQAALRQLAILFGSESAAAKETPLTQMVGTEGMAAHLLLEPVGVVLRCGRRVRH
jgi:hypothetical protein